jgi:hypothetical protein
MDLGATVDDMGVGVTFGGMPLATVDYVDLRANHDL